MSKYVEKSMDLYPADEMLTDMGAIYQRHLSKDDVDGLIVFYSSPTGQHLLDAQPVIAKEYMPLVMGKVSGTKPGDDQGNDEGDGGDCAIEAGSSETGSTKPPAK